MWRMCGRIRAGQRGLRPPIDRNDDGAHLRPLPAAARSESDTFRLGRRSHAVAKGTATVAAVGLLTSELIAMSVVGSEWG